MCGRFTNQYSWEELHALYDLSNKARPKSNFPPRYNIAPTQTSFVVRETEGERELLEMRWGLLPKWAKKPGDGARMINARSETVATKPAYRSPFKSRPCLVVADGFYEWQVTKGGKQPWYFTTKKDERFAFAGLWEPKSLTEYDTFTLLTCEPNSLCAKIHDRMPVMLQPKDFARWLSTPEERAKLLKPFPATKMQTWPVGKEVGSPKNTGPELIEPIEG